MRAILNKVTAQDIFILTFLVVIAFASVSAIINL